METIYFCIVLFLLCLAVFDLFVGVSNDAVNFLNSAIGARVAKLRTVLIIASVGARRHNEHGHDGCSPTWHHETHTLLV